MRKALPYALIMLALFLFGCLVHQLYRGEKLWNLSFKQDVVDHRLQYGPDARWMGGDYQIPRGEEHGIVSVFYFKEGRFWQRGTATTWSAQYFDSRILPHGVFWYPSAYGKGMTVSELGFHDQDNNEPYPHLNGGVARAYGSQDLGELHGYRVIGIGLSDELANNAGKANDMGAAIGDLLKRRYAIALVVKPFPTLAAALQWLGRDFTWPANNLPSPVP